MVQSQGSALKLNAPRITLLAGIQGARTGLAFCLLTMFSAHSCTAECSPANPTEGY